MLCYTGIGSRQTPQPILSEMRRCAAYLARQGLCLRSGGAPKADSAFEEGADLARGAKEIFIPWPGFEQRTTAIVPGPAAFDRAMAIMVDLHPAWSRLSAGARKLHARNVLQVLGQNMDSPSAFVLCWTPDGCVSEATRTRESGGTATAIVLAERNGVPVINMAADDWRMRLRQAFDALAASGEASAHRAR